MRKLKVSEQRLAREYGLKLGTCVMCKRNGVTLTYLAFKDKKAHRMFGLGGTHVLCDLGYLVNGHSVYEPEGVRLLDQDRLHICETCSMKHEDQRYEDENGSNPHGTPLTDEFRKAITITPKEWDEMVTRAVEQHRRWKEQNSGPQE